DRPGPVTVGWCQGWLQQQNEVQPAAPPEASADEGHLGVFSIGTTVAVPVFGGHQGNLSMGTDIYLHAEKRSDGVWHHCGELTDLEGRNYQFFAILANVMNPIRSTVPFDYIVQPRGFPDDMSEELRHDGLLRSGHDPGWVTLRELLDFDWA